MDFSNLALPRFPELDMANIRSARSSSARGQK
jgi:hypothetical protein